jgi:peptide/nickel transport system substrate-binding protein
MKRRMLIAAGGVAAGGLALASPRLARSQPARVLTFVPQTNLAILDPTATTGAVTGNHAFMVFDTLYGVDASYRVQPQMAAGHEVSADGLVWRITLRAGLRFHDGAAVLARDCVASLRRWAQRDGFGQLLMASTDELSAQSDTVIQFRLKRPFPLLPEALGKISSYTAFMMPERLAARSGAAPMSEVVGSGPFRFVSGEYMSGVRVVYERFAGYVPRPDGVASLTAGPKIVNVDRVEWRVMPDPSTSLAALQTGEVDWWEAPTSDMIPVLAQNPRIRVEVLDPLGEIAILRFNQTHAPFDNAAIRRALLGAVNQADFMTAVAGTDRSMWHDGVGIYCPGTPFATSAGLEPLTGPRDMAKVQAALKAAGYDGRRVVFMAPADSPETLALSEVGVDMLKRAGMNVELQTSDLGTEMQRRANITPSGLAAWDVFLTRFPSLGLSSPATNILLRGTGLTSWPGWPVDPQMEALRVQWFDAPDEASRKALATQIQVHAMQSVPYVPLGQYVRQTAHRSNVTGLLTGMPLFWNLRKA